MEKYTGNSVKDQMDEVKKQSDDIINELFGEIAKGPQHGVAPVKQQGEN